jgi:hypothetical protein
VGTRGKSEDLAYTAGIFDGEGYISILRVQTKNRKNGRTHDYLLVVGMSNTDRRTIETLKKQWGGTTMLDNRVYPNRKPIFMWRATALVALRFIKDIYPYMRVKKPQATLGMRFQSQLSHKWGRAGMPDKELARRDNLCVQIRALNASHFSRPQRLSEGAPSYGEYMRRTDEAIVQA